MSSGCWIESMYLLVTGKSCGCRPHSLIRPAVYRKSSFGPRTDRCETLIIVLYRSHHLICCNFKNIEPLECLSKVTQGSKTNKSQSIQHSNRAPFTKYYHLCDHEFFIITFMWLSSFVRQQIYCLPITAMLWPRQYIPSPSPWPRHQGSRPRQLPSRPTPRPRQ